MITTERLPDWGSRYQRELARVSATPFVWGKNDCLVGLLHASLYSITGLDAVDRWRGRYVTALGAVRVMRNEGYTSIRAGVAALLPEVHVSRALPGDIVLVYSGDEFGDAICVYNSGSVLGMTDRGVLPVAHGPINSVFAVGDR